MAVLVMALGLASRRSDISLPPFIAAYAGDALWALMVFLWVGVVRPCLSLPRRTLLAWVLACAVEVIQLYHAPWIDTLRATTLGGLVLGHDFVWSDIVCYSAGVALGALVEYAFSAWQRPAAAAP